jgi:hypothetical protein
VLGFAQGVQGEVNDDNWCDGLVQNSLDISMYAQSQIVHLNCLMKWPKEKNI